MNAFPLRHPLAVILVSIGILLLAILPLTQVSINSDLESYMPETMNSKRTNRQIAEYFSTAENLLIIVDAQSPSTQDADILQAKNLQVVQQMSDQLQQLPSVQAVHSLFQTSHIQHPDGNLLIEPAIPAIPETKEETEHLRRQLLKNKFASGLVISDDFRYTLLMLEVNRDSSAATSDALLLGQVKKIISGATRTKSTKYGVPTVQKSEFNGNVYVTGQPYLRNDANQKISRDLIILLPIGLLLMLLFLWISFRDLRWVLLPFSIVVFSTVVAMALIPALGWEISLIGVLIPILMIAIANNYGVHVLVRFQELIRTYPQPEETADRSWSHDLHTHLLSTTIRYLRKPVWLCGLTTIAGTLGLLAHLLIPARQMGVVASLGIAFSLTLSLTYLPAVMSYFKTDRWAVLRQQPPSKLTNTLQKSGQWIIRHPYRPIWLAIGVLVICSAGITQLKVAPDSSKILPEKHEFNQAIRIADEHFGGSKLLQILIEGDARDPQLLKAIDSVATQLEKHPLVGHATSLATLIRTLHEGSDDTLTAQTNPAGKSVLPDSKEAIAQYLELYGMSANTSDYERFIDFSYSHTLLTVHYRSASLREVNSLISEIRSALDRHQLSYQIGGTSLTDKEISESVRTGQFSSLGLALLAILILIGLIFRSLQAGLIGCIPLISAVICTFGIMGWSGIELDIVTALLSSISIGLGVDFTIHLFWRIKHELTENGGNWNDAVLDTLAGTGRGITLNALSVMLGFSVLLLSAFPFVKAFGFLIILSLFLCLASALIIIPALCLLLKPRFLYSEIKN